MALYLLVTVRSFNKALPDIFISKSPSLEFSAKHDPIMISKQVGDPEDQISGRRPKTNVHYRCEELFLLFPLPLSLAVQPSSTRVRG